MPKIDVRRHGRYTAQPQDEKTLPSIILEAEQDALDQLVELFATAVKGHLRQSVSRGRYRGWDEPGLFLPFFENLTQAVGRGDPIEIATLAAFLWNHEDDPGAVQMVMNDSLPAPGTSRAKQIEAMCLGYRRDFDDLAPEWQDVIRRMMNAVLHDGLLGNGFDVVPA